MEMVLDVVVAVLAAFGAVSIFWCIFCRKPEGPAAFGKTGQVYAVINAGDCTEELQNSINALLWLKENGAPEMTLFIADDGMQCDARRLAENYCALEDDIYMCSLSDILRC